MEQSKEKSSALHYTSVSSYCLDYGRQLYFVHIIIIMSCRRHGYPRPSLAENVKAYNSYWEDKPYFLEIFGHSDGDSYALHILNIIPHFLNFRILTKE